MLLGNPALHPSRHLALTPQTCNRPPPVHLSDICPEPGILSRMGSPFIVIGSTTLDHPYRSYLRCPAL